MDELTLSAPAKLNLALDILGSRPDGYHELRMVMQTVSLCDTVTVRTGQGGGIRLSLPGSSLPSGEENLAWRAAAAFFRATGLAAGADITVQKRIPVQAGLAGGSTDAAAVLRALRRLLAPELPPAELEAIGAEVGSDVPFCVRGGTALAEGRGERLQSLAPLPSCHIVICKPAFGLSTPALFRRADGAVFSRRPDTAVLTAALAAGDLRALSGAMANVFETLLTPEEGAIVAMIRQTMRTWGALNAMMTGSGPTVFGLFSPGDEGLARRAARALEGPSMEVFLARPAAGE